MKRSARTSVHDAPDLHRLEDIVWTPWDFEVGKARWKDHDTGIGRQRRSALELAAIRLLIRPPERMPLNSE